MTDFIDKAINVGIGVEKKVKELVDELESAGEAREGGKGEAAGENPEGTPVGGGEDSATDSPPLGGRESIENRIVDEGVRAVREMVNLLKSGKEKIDSELTESAEKVTDRLNLATKDDVDVVREMARIAREKTEALEERIKALEEK